MIQRYLVDDVLIHRETKQLLKVLDVFKDFDYTTFYDYEVMYLDTNRIERLAQSYMKYKYVSEKDINIEINNYEKDINKFVEAVSTLKWLKQEMRDGIKLIENRKDSKR